MTRRNHSKIPIAVDWAGYKDDLDARYAHKLFFGKSNDEIQGLFTGGRSIERASELLYLPRRAFQYYVFGFGQFLLSDSAAGESDAASSFLRLLISREERDVGSVSRIYSRLAPIVESVASRQEHYDADPNIYVNFQELQVRLAALCAEA